MMQESNRTLFRLLFKKRMISLHSRNTTGHKLLSRDLLSGLYWPMQWPIPKIDYKTTKFTKHFFANARSHSFVSIEKSFANARSYSSGIASDRSKSCLSKARSKN